uniref:RCK N-terminal domain-containing protein n=1 Tax=Acrobeloides nanus TaxID=290746 RepID=A0A914C8I7_9BILA
MIELFSLLICLIFTGTCGIQHLQRAGEQQFDLFTSFYFVMVTFSTVGYGDCYPDTWMSRLYVVILICVAFGVLPSKIEALGQTWLERQKSGVDYTNGLAKGEAHVVVTISQLEADFIKDFLDEFYAHPSQQNYLVVLLSPCELDNRMKMLLKIPLWSHRVLYIRGSVLKDEDLERAQLSTAKACFILSARHVTKKNESDEHTILNSWAVKDFAPHVPQYVHVFRPETKIHIEHAEIVICEDEFKYSLLANNCICPGISTYITLLMHTSRGEEGQKSAEPWHKVYGFHSGNEIYDIIVSESKFFGEYIGKTFTYASYHAHKKYGICLVGIKRNSQNSKIRLNPGHSHIILASDRLYYIALTNEESLTDFLKGINDQKEIANFASQIARKGTATLEQLESVKKDAKADCSTGKVRPYMMDSSTEDDYNNGVCKSCGVPCIEDTVVKTYPPVVAYIGTSPTVCHMLKQKRPFCCLQISEPCDHCDFFLPNHYKWKNPAIIVAVDKTSTGLYNLIIPLRAYYRPTHELNPIILLLELEDNETPNPAFLDVIAWFPMIYWMQGKISSLDNLLKAGVCLAEHVIVVQEGARTLEEHLADCSTIITVQKIHRMFPNLNMITELTHASNMRFMQFDANDFYTLQQSKFEKLERRNGSDMPFMFRLPFAKGGVFSANMLDRLLYQAHVKSYLVDFVKLLLGIEQSPGSGFLASIKITQEDLWIRTYGRLYQKICASLGDTPIGMYRTKEMDSSTISTEMDKKLQEERKARRQVVTMQKSSGTGRKKLRELVKSRMKNLGMDEDDYAINDSRKTLSYVIINPSYDLELEAGDIVYVLRAPVKESARGSKMCPKRLLKKPSQISPESMLLTTYHDETSTEILPSMI